MRDVIALLMEGRDVAGEEEGGGVHQGASVVDHEAQRVSSPGSENSKDGKEGGPRGEGNLGENVLYVWDVCLTPPSSPPPQTQVAR